jgi:hypothetical protein
MELRAFTADQRPPNHIATIVPSAGHLQVTWEPIRSVKLRYGFL